MNEEENLVEQLFAYLEKSHLITESLEKAEIKVLDDFLKKNPTVEKILNTLSYNKNKNNLSLK